MPALKKIGVRLFQVLSLTAGCRPRKRGAKSQSRSNVAPMGRLIDDRRVFLVRDNGAGFDPARAGRLFAPCQRLHAETEFDGIGIGRAAVKRLIARHGGRVWAQAEAGRGGAFFFTL